MTTYINTDQSGTYSIGSADTYVFGPNIIQTIDSPSAAAVSVQIGVTGANIILSSHVVSMGSAALIDSGNRLVTTQSAVIFGTIAGEDDNVVTLDGYLSRIDTPEFSVLMNFFDGNHIALRGVAETASDVDSLGMVVRDGNQVDISGTLTSYNGMQLRDANEVDISGSITATVNGIRNSPTGPSASNNFISVSGDIRAGSHAITLTGDTNNLDISGSLRSVDSGISLTGNGNHIDIAAGGSVGLLAPNPGVASIELNGIGNTINNFGTIGNGNSGEAIRVTGFFAATAINNHGAIFGGVSLGEGSDVFSNVGSGYVVGAINAADGNDTILGGMFMDSVNGGNGNDVILSLGGADDLRGGNGNDLIDAGDGDDRALGGAGNDSMVGGDGLDSLNGGTGDDTIYGGSGDDNIDGSAQDDRLFGQGGHDTLQGGDGNDSISGAAGDDIVLGGAGQDVILGGSGDDTIDAGGGADSVRGDSGDDSINGGFGNDVIDGGAGHDTVFGGDQNDLLRGGDGNDFLKGEGGMDLLRGGTGDDELDGGGNSDTLFGEEGNDLIDGREGSDSIDGGTGNDVIYGGSSMDTILGGSGDDTILGGDDGDRIEGGAGNDMLFGDHGADTFVYDAFAGHDVVRDFEVGMDTFEMVGIDQADVTLTAVGTGDTLVEVASLDIKILVENVTVAELSSFSDFDFV
ncbi:calcium-binding protein [Salipiger sp.]|uniref:calcium-binding protein n=1 Tax=Salipiger sp. TaxID=2078585 RepID=UPI003A984338